MVSIADVRAAAGRLKGQVRRTALLENIQLNEQAGGRVFIKPECLQISGSFKIRGAYNRLSQLSGEEKARGVVAFSSGNHAQGVALAARWLDIHAAIVMPETAAKLKIENTRGYGAEVILYDPVSESREEIGVRLAAERGATLVPSYDDPHIIAGQGTAGLEIAEDLAALDITPHILASPAGGGGLISGATIAIRAYYPEILIIPAEPEEFDDTKRSLEAGTRQGNKADARSFCDALLSPMPGKLTFPILQMAGAVGVSVSDDEVRRAIRFAAKYLKLVVEPGGAVALAAILAGKLEVKGKNTAVILSGGNIDLAQLSAVTA